MLLRCGSTLPSMRTPPGLLPFDQMQKALRDQTTEAVKDLLEDELFGDVGTVTVEQQMADLWETEGG